MLCPHVYISHTYLPLSPLGEFSNNTAHSLGWFELRTFEDYFPMDGEVVLTVLSHFILHLPYCKVLWIVSQVNTAAFGKQGLCVFNQYNITSHRISLLHRLIFSGFRLKIAPEF